jgi:hypothetical protein
MNLLILKEIKESLLKIKDHGYLNKKVYENLKVDLP